MWKHFRGPSQMPTREFQRFQPQLSAFDLQHVPSNFIMIVTTCNNSIMMNHDLKKWHSIAVLEAFPALTKPVQLHFAWRGSMAPATKNPIARLNAWGFIVTGNGQAEEQKCKALTCQR